MDDGDPHVAEARGFRPSVHQELSVSVCDGRGRQVPDRGLGRWLTRTAPRRLRGLVTVALVSDAVARRLNRQFRGVDRPTDVLSFPAEPGWVDGRWQPAEPGRRPGPWLGDVVIATGVARRQAERLGHPFQAELKCLALHGLMHLVGFDHERDDGRMARAERRWAARGRLAAGLIGRAGA